MAAYKEQTHWLKTLPQYWDAVQRNEKHFEIRRDDRGFQRGDLVRLVKYFPSNHTYLAAPDTPDAMLYPTQVYNSQEEPLLKHRVHTQELAYAAYLEKRISYILTGGQFGLEPGYVILSLENL